MSDIFELKIRTRPPRDKYKLNLEMSKTNQVKFRTKSLWTFFPKIWNSLLHLTKLAENLINFKRIIKKWNGEQYKWNAYQKVGKHMHYFVKTIIYRLQFLLNHNHFYYVELSILISNLICKFIRFFW